MKRNIDSFRKVLEFVEQKGSITRVIYLIRDKEDIAGISEEEFIYHFQLCLDEGFIDGDGASFKRLTNRGHDYLDLMRSDTVLNEAKSRLTELGGWSLSLLGEVLSAVAKEKLGLG